MFKNVSNSFLCYIVYNTSNVCLMETKYKFILNKKVFGLQRCCSIHNNDDYFTLTIDTDETRIKLNICNIFQLVDSLKNNNIEEYLKGEGCENKYYFYINDKSMTHYQLQITGEKIRIIVNHQMFYEENIMVISILMNKFIHSEFKKMLNKIILIVEQNK